MSGMGVERWGRRGEEGAPLRTPRCKEPAVMNPQRVNDSDLGCNSSALAACQLEIPPRPMPREPGVF